MTKKFLCALFVLMLSWPALADVIEINAPAPDVQEVHKGNAAAFLLQRDLGNSMGFRSNEGLQVVYMGTYRAKQPENTSNKNTSGNPDEEIKPDESIFSVFMVKSDKDTALKLDVKEGFDTRTNKFSWRTSDWGYIADSQVNSNARDIQANFWVRVTFWHVLPFKLGDNPLISRIGFVINNSEITLKRFRPRNYGDWPYVEANFVKPLEEDTKRIEFDELEVSSLN